MDFDFTFPARYQIEEAELPGDGREIIYHPGGSTTHGKDGLLLRIRPDSAREWIGCFAFGHHSYLHTAVFSSPDPDCVFIVSKGAAYWANAGCPERCRVVDFFPVLGVRAMPVSGLLLIYDFTTLGLLGSDGSLWRSSRLCWDELRITEIAGGVVSGVGYDPTNSLTSECQWSLDLKSRSVLKTGYPKELGKL